MANHAHFVALAKRLIAKNGRKIRIQLLAESGGDPQKPWKGSTADDIANEHGAMAVFVPAIGRELGTLVTDANMLKRSTHVAIVEAVKEDLEEKITRIKDADNTIFRADWVQCLKPGNVTVIYVIGMSR